MKLDALEAWLAQHTGLIADKLGPGQLPRVARGRMLATGAKDPAAYLALLAGSTAEQLQLIEGIVVTETWFFRDRGTLDGLVRYVTQSWAARHPTASCHILSVPCSTGEEPYSIAMALALAAFPVGRLQLDAVDISRESIARAQTGAYGRNSFRGADLAFRQIFFEPRTEQVWQLREHVRAAVRFQAANLLGDDFSIGRPLYDVIFCRNLLIYFDPPVQTRVLQMLRRLLADDGLLALGPGEAVLALEQGFVPLPGESMFLFRKAPSASVALPPVRPRRERPVPAPRLSKPVPGPAISRPVRPAVRTPVDSPLAELRKLADAGELGGARLLGEKLLGENGPSTDLCYLVAVIADAAGDVRRAEEYYRKALYLDPRHAESLAHLALLLDKHGDERSAAAFRARARRLGIKGAAG
jgi:chemotaxis protein methyltransferase WspC